MKSLRSPIKYISSLLLVALLSGCVPVSKQEKSVSSPLPIDIEPHVIVQNTERDRLKQLNGIMRYEQLLQNFSPEDLEFERIRLETAPEKATDSARIKLALLYNTKEAPFHDTDRAKEILRSCLERNGSTRKEMRNLSNLILSMLEEITAQEKNMAIIKAELARERIQKQILKEQLDALKAIEKSINERTHSLSKYIPK